MTRDAATKITHRLRLIAIGVTAAGALITFLAVGFLFPAVGGSRSINVRSAWVNGPIIVADLLAFAYGYTRLRRRHVAEALRWLQEDRAPDGREHQLTLGLATYFVKWDALGWSLSAIGFALSAVAVGGLRFEQASDAAASRGSATGLQLAEGFGTLRRRPVARWSMLGMFGQTMTRGLLNALIVVLWRRWPHCRRSVSSRSRRSPCFLGHVAARETCRSPLEPGRSVVVHHSLTGAGRRAR